MKNKPINNILLVCLAIGMFASFNYQQRANNISSENASSLRAKIIALVNAESQSPVPFSGSVLVSKKGKIILNESFATKGLPHPAHQQPEAKYFIASITKHFTAVALLRLYQQKKLHLDQPIADFIAGIPWGKTVTLRHLLTHRSGVVRDVVNRYNQPISLDSLVEKIKQTKLRFVPGTKFAYSNPGYLLLSKVIEKVSRQTYFDYLQQHILTPLKLKNTGQLAWKQIVPSLIKGQSIGYDSRQAITTVVSSVPFVSQTRYGAGCLYATTKDLMKYTTAFFEGKVLPDSLRHWMTTPTSRRYGAGWFVDTTNVHGKLVWHTGRTYGFRSGVYYYPAQEVCIIILANYDRANRNSLAKNIANIMFGKPYKIPQVPDLKPLKSASFKPYLGDYMLLKDTRMRILADHKNLYIQSHGAAKELIYPTSDTSLVSMMRDMQLSFSRPVNGLSDTLTWTFRGKSFKCPRIKN